MNEKAQLEKIEEMKNIYSSGGISRRRRAGGSAQVRRSKLLFAPDAAQEEYKRSIRYFSYQNYIDDVSALNDMALMRFVQRSISMYVHSSNKRLWCDVNSSRGSELTHTFLSSKRYINAINYRSEYSLY